MKKKNIFDLVVQIDSLGALLSVNPSLKAYAEYIYNGNNLVQEKYYSLREQVYAATAYGYDCKGNLASKTTKNDIYQDSEGKQPVGSFWFKYDCHGNIAKEYQKLAIRGASNFIFETRLIAYHYANQLLTHKDIYNESIRLIQREIYFYDDLKNLIEIRLEDYTT